jgi:hypothetical protein
MFIGMFMSSYVLILYFYSKFVRQGNSYIFLFHQTGVYNTYTKPLHFLKSHLKWIGTH